MNQIKKLIKKSTFYQIFLKKKFLKNLSGWTEEDKERLNFYKNFIKKDNLVFDVGANIGNRSKIFLRLNAKVVAFEPQKFCIEILQRGFQDERNFILVKDALGSKPGESEIFISDESTISTLSESWINAIKKSGRFAANSWNKKEKIKVDTLDNAIIKYGVPSFIKIDVEGFEYEVISGLRKPIDLISIEFASEFIENTIKCINHLNSLAESLFQIVIGENINFYFEDWVSKQEVITSLYELVNKDKLVWGDIYIKQK